MSKQNNIYSINPDYTNILLLHKKLEEAGIQHKIDILYDGWQITYYKNGKRYGDVVTHCWSYGSSEDLMEANGFPECGDDVLGSLSVDEAFELFKAADRVEELPESYPKIKLFGVPGIYIKDRVDRDKVPICLYVYDIRGEDFNSDKFQTVEYYVTANFAGTVLLSRAIYLGEYAIRDIQSGFKFIGGDTTVDEFLKFASYENEFLELFEDFIYANYDIAKALNSANESSYKNAVERCNDLRGRLLLTYTKCKETHLKEWEYLVKWVAPPYYISTEKHDKKEKS